MWYSVGRRRGRGTLLDSTKGAPVFRVMVLSAAGGRIALPVLHEYLVISGVRCPTSSLNLLWSSYSNSNWYSWIMLGADNIDRPEYE